MILFAAASRVVTTLPKPPAVVHSGVLWGSEGSWRWTVTVCPCGVVLAPVAPRYQKRDEAPLAGSDPMRWAGLCPGASRSAPPVKPDSETQRSSDADPVALVTR